MQQELTLRRGELRTRCAGSTSTLKQGVVMLPRAKAGGRPVCKTSTSTICGITAQQPHGSRRERVGALLGRDGVEPDATQRVMDMLEFMATRPDQISTW